MHAAREEAPRRGPSAGAALLAVYCGLALLVVPTSSGWAQPPNPPALKRILILHQELASRPFRARFNVAFVDAIRSEGAPIDIYEQAMETERFPGAAQLPIVTGHFQNKYADHRIDVIVAVGTRAFAFAKANRNLFGNPAIVAVLSAGGQMAEAGATTGLQGGGWIDGTIDLALRVRPETRFVYVVDGSRDRSGSLQAEFERQVSARGERVKLVYLRDLPIDDLVRRVAAIRPDGIVIFLRQTMRTETEDLDPFDGLSRVVAAAPVPVFSHMDEFIGRGVLGGVTWRFETDAKRLAAMAARIAGGASVRDIPPGRITYATQFDWRQLQRWGISEARLPAGSVVRSRPPSLARLSGRYVVAGVLICVAQLALIIGLLVQRVARRSAEREARANAERYRSVVETQNELICRFLPDTTLTFVNDAYCRFWKKTREDLLGRPFTDLIPVGVRDAVRDRVSGLTEGTDSHEHPVLLADGTVGWQHWTNHVIVDDRRQVVELQGIGRDVTEQKRAQDAVAQLEARNSAILRAIPDLMFVLQRDGTYLDCHARDPHGLYMPPTEFIGRKVSDVMPADLAATFLEALERACQTGAIQVVEYELLMGETRYYEARIVHAGEDRVLSIVRDVTESKRAVQLNRRLAGRLIVSQEAERQRIARELHDDVSQKIALLNIEIDCVAAQLDAGQLRSRLWHLSRRAGELASDVHNLSHELHPSKLQTLGLVPAIQALCRDMSRGGVQVAFTHDVASPPIESNVSLCLFRIVQEALHNVARHSQASEAKVRLTSDNRSVSLHVVDPGVGFDPRDIRQNGLGLMSMRERVGFLRGKLAIHARPGGGTRIGVSIPLSPNGG
jgi:PAS domain S-box-containing protein